MDLLDHVASVMPILSIFQLSHRLTKSILRIGIRQGYGEYQLGEG